MTDKTSASSTSAGRVAAGSSRPVEAKTDVKTDVDVKTSTETRTDETSHATAGCVVDDGTAHTGRAVPGTVVCSAHTMRFRNDGTPRDPALTGLAPRVVEKDTLLDTDPKNQEMVRDARSAKSGR